MELLNRWWQNGKIEVDSNSGAASSLLYHHSLTKQLNLLKWRHWAIIITALSLSNRWKLDDLTWIIFPHDLCVNFNNKYVNLHLNYACWKCLCTLRIYDIAKCSLFPGLCVGGLKIHKFQGVQNKSSTVYNLVKNRYQRLWCWVTS